MPIAFDGVGAGGGGWTYLGTTTDATYVIYNATVTIPTAWTTPTTATMTYAVGPNPAPMTYTINNNVTAGPIRPIPQETEL